MVRFPPDFVFPAALSPATIAAFRALPDADTSPDIGAVMASVDYPTNGIGPRADQLTPAQRAVIEVITDRDIRTRNNDVDQWMPRDRADRRAWLGLDAPRPLDRLYTFTLGGVVYTEPGWRAMKLLRRADDAKDDITHVDAWLQTVPVAERLAMWGQVNLHWPRIWDLRENDFFDPDEPELLRGLRDEGKDWAPAYADEVLREREAGRGTKQTPPWVLLALVRAGLPIEPRWDELVPNANDAILGEILDAIPPSRRGDALATALGRMKHPSHALRAAKAHLPRAPSEAALRHAIDCIRVLNAPRRRNLEALAAAVAEHPGLREVLAPHLATLPKPIFLGTLRLRDVAREGEDAVLGDIDKAQLLVAGKAYFGKAVPIETLLSLDGDDEASLRHGLVHRAVADEKGKHVYGMWEYAGDSLTFTPASGGGTVARVQIPLGGRP